MGQPDDPALSILAQYDERRAAFDAMGPVVEGLVPQCLGANDLNAHAVTHRVKSP